MSLELLPWTSRWPDSALKGDENVRICNLGFELPDDTLDLTDELRKPGGTIRLLNIQSQMLDAARRNNGLLAFAGTGTGKTYTALLLGTVMEDVDRVLIFAPSSTLKNLHTERMELRQHFHLHSDMQFHSYEAMQRATPEGQLDYIEAEILRHGNDPNRTLLVFDEAHALKNLTSARGLRTMRAVLKYPGLRICALSGSMTDKSIHDYLHIAWMALRDKSPVPSPWLWPHDPNYKRNLPPPPSTIAHHRATDIAQSWAAILDKDGQADGRQWYDFDAIWHWAFGDNCRPFHDFIGQERVNLARRAQQYRLRTTPGVVLSRATSLENTALLLHGIDDIELPDNVEEAIEIAKEEGVDPDGNPLPDASSVWRTVRQLAQGFYYVWDWPVVQGRVVRDEAWLMARSTWNKMVRKEIIESAETGYDSALLVYTTIYRQILRLHSLAQVLEAWLEFISRSHKDEAPGKVSVRERELYEAWIAAGGSQAKFVECEEYFREQCRANALEAAWLAWSATQKHKQRPPTKAVWMSSFFIDRVMQWVKESEAAGFPPLVWYDQQAVGEELMRRGIPMYGAGTNPNPGNAVDPSYAFTCALSIKTHSEGKNLQPWSKSIVLCPPASGTRWEQMLARTHRTKQTASSVHYTVMQHVKDFREALSGARAAADYVQTSTDNEQKLLRAVLENIKLPKVGSEKFQQLEGYEDEADEDED